MSSVEVAPHPRHVRCPNLQVRMICVAAQQLLEMKSSSEILKIWRKVHGWPMDDPWMTQENHDHQRFGRFLGSSGRHSNWEYSSVFSVSTSYVKDWKLAKGCCWMPPKKHVCGGHKESSPSSLTSFVPVTTQVCLLCLRGTKRVFLSRFSFSFQHENHPRVGYGRTAETWSRAPLWWVKTMLSCKIWPISIDSDAPLKPAFFSFPLDLGSWQMAPSRNFNPIPEQSCRPCRPCRPRNRHFPKRPWTLAFMDNVAYNPQ